MNKWDEGFKKKTTFCLVHQNEIIVLEVTHNKQTKITQALIEKEKFSIKNKKLDDPELFPQTFIYEPRRWKITIDRHY